MEKSMQLSVSAGGEGALVKASVIPFPRENLSVRSSAIRVSDPASGQMEVWTGPRLRTQHLISLPSMAHREYRAAVKDDNEMWSEWSGPQSFAMPHFSGTLTQNVSIGSGATTDLALEEPAIRFPLLNLGSSKQEIFRTLASEGFYDEVRRSKWSVKRAAFHCVFSDLDEQETLLLHRFYRALNGPLTPFWFDWTDPDTGVESRYIVRFRDPTLVDELFVVDRSSMEFTLVELVGTVDGSAV
jgi:hypothetical protein